MQTRTHMTRHARKRFKQRGFREDELELLMLAGVPVKDGIFVCARSARDLSGRLRRMADRCERLIGSWLVVEGDAVITAYRPGRRKTRSLMRQVEERSLRRMRP
jgi:hypothetical protein